MPLLLFAVSPHLRYFVVNVEIPMGVFDDLEELCGILHEGGHSLVVRNRGELRTFDGRDVDDLYRLYHEEPSFLRGALVADKVIGKAAACLIVAAGVSGVHTDVVSAEARRFLLWSVKVPEDVATVERIANRMRTGGCPMERFLRECHSAEECLPRLEEWMGMTCEQRMEWISANA